MQTITFKQCAKAIITLTTTLLLTTTSLNSVADNSYTPAQFGSALNQLTAKVNLPESFSGGFTTIAVYCQTDVATTGLLSNTVCYENTDVANLEGQTLSALEAASFTPAKVGDNAVPVRMQFRVVYSRSGDQPDIVMLPNLGSLQNQYGYDYYAPQERLDSGSWYQKYQSDTSGNGKAFFNDGRLTRVIGTVNTSGDVTTVSTLEARGKGKRDADSIETTLKQTKFIPGVVNGKSTEMHYVAVLNYAK